ncbi:HAMP domain-containing sensor histidine kinase [Anaerocolumna chitinilytica]|uniref:histidine kinase n=1 Tax=Anaerocolumna chitinilytica TaxID=1727145 RepID=A0A7I8DPQ9_9FIRM|nr:HAMP domain-containing sensor histidine kinase [Anaerocolumna chitinilytica]BCJ99294.1 hypothetical protein bsdcttw_23350 [Anaerocolumna chitinilytica]
MKLKTYAITLLLLFFSGIACAIYLTSRPVDNRMDNIAVNDIVSDIRADWSFLQYPNYILPGLSYGMDYTVIDNNGVLLATTRQGLSENENSAILHRDTIITITDTKDVVLGKIIFYNNSQKQLKEFKENLLFLFLVLILIVFLSVSLILYSIHRRILNPFRSLKSFAENIADGNLDIPLTMDKGNTFGAFTESFDLMRTQLATARENERLATISKKELVASLSHDIKTPIASIKAIAELMSVTALDNKTRQYLDTINAKADQINLLINNMFHATLEELNELKVTTVEIPSHAVYDMIQDADYRHLTVTTPIPDCLIIADPLRLTQVLDNIISNSYKYSGTGIHVQFELTDSLIISIADSGPGVLPEELPLLKQKYYRGKNALKQQGSGIGLYISDYFMDKMQGTLQCKNKKDGFIVELSLSLA